MHIYFNIFDEKFEASLAVQYLADTILVIASSRIPRLRLGTRSTISTPTCHCEERQATKQSRWRGNEIATPRQVGAGNDTKDY
jgi:hypothetical protein